MSPSVNEAQAQWLEQLAAMRKAIAELNLPAHTSQAPAYGDDLEFDDDDLSTAISGDDIWDITDDEYQGHSRSDPLDHFPRDSTERSHYDQQWLAEKCGHIARRTSGLDAEALRSQIMAILASDSSSE